MAHDPFDLGKMQLGWMTIGRLSGQKVLRPASGRNGGFGLGRLVDTQVVQDHDFLRMQGRYQKLVDIGLKG